MSVSGGAVAEDLAEAATLSVPVSCLTPTHSQHYVSPVPPIKCCERLPPGRRAGGSVSVWQSY